MFKISVVAFLFARLVAEGYPGRNGRNSEHNGAGALESEKLLRAGDLAARLNLPESWIRNEERAGRIPSIRPGKYVRFKLGDVERALAEQQHRGA